MAYIPPIPFANLRRPSGNDPAPAAWPRPSLATPPPMPNEGWGENPVLSIEYWQTPPEHWVLHLTPEGANMARIMQFKEFALQSFRIDQAAQLAVFAPFLGNADRKRLGLEHHRQIEPSEAGGAPLVFRLRVQDREIHIANRVIVLPRWFNLKFAYFAKVPADNIYNKAFEMAGWHWMGSTGLWATAQLPIAASMAAYGDYTVSDLLDKKGCPMILHPWLRFAPAVIPMRDKYYLAMRNNPPNALPPPHMGWRGRPPTAGWMTSSPNVVLPYTKWMPIPLADAFLRLQATGGLNVLKNSSKLDLFKIENGGFGFSVAEAGKVGKPWYDVCGKCNEPITNQRSNSKPCEKGQCAKIVCDWGEMRKHPTQIKTPKGWRSMIEHFAIDEEEIRNLNFDSNPQPTNEELDQLLPPGHMYFPHQYDAIRHCCAWKTSIEGDVMGAGKTLVCLKTVQIKVSKEGYALAVVPANLVLKWVQDAEEWLDRPAIAMRKRDMPKQGTLSVMSYEAARDNLHIAKIPWEIIICDEAHNIKNIHAKRSKAILALDADRWIFVTGTALYNRPKDLYPFLHKANPDLFTSLPQFAKGFPLKDPANPTAQENDGLDLMGNILRSSILIRRPRDILLANMPKEPAPQIVPIQIPLVSGRGIAQQEKLALETWKKANGVTPEVFKQISILRQHIGEAKLPALKDWVITMALSGEPFLLFTYHRRFASELVQVARNHGMKPGLLTGDVPPRERFQNGEDFQAGKLDCVIGTMDAAGVGINLFRARYVAFGEIDWNPSKHEQARGRAWRPGQTHPMETLYFTVQESMMESHICANITGKSEAIIRGMGDGGDTKSVLELLKSSEEAQKSGKFRKHPTVKEMLE